MKITYCINKDCPFKDCQRHLSHIKEEGGHHTLADFSGVCRRYIRYLVDKIIGGI